MTAKILSFIPLMNYKKSRPPAPAVDPKKLAEVEATVVECGTCGHDEFYLILGGAHRCANCLTVLAEYAHFDTREKPDGSS